jgi:hypothetical protein
MVRAARRKIANSLISTAAFLMSDHKIPQIFLWIASKVSPEQINRDISDYRPSPHEQYYRNR